MLASARYACVQPSLAARTAHSNQVEYHALDQGPSYYIHDNLVRRAVLFTQIVRVSRHVRGSNQYSPVQGHGTKTVFWHYDPRGCINHIVWYLDDILFRLGPIQQSTLVASEIIMRRFVDYLPCLLRKAFTGFQT